MASSVEGQVVACHTEDEWKTHFEAASNSNKLVVIDFTASWCGPCRFIAPIFAEFAKKWTDVVFLKVDVDELKAIATEYKVEAMPTFVFLKGKVEVDRVVGARKDDLEKKITTHSAVVTSA